MRRSSDAANLVRCMLLGLPCAVTDIKVHVWYSAYVENGECRGEMRKLRSIALKAGRARVRAAFEKQAATREVPSPELSAALGEVFGSNTLELRAKGLAWIAALFGLEALELAKGQQELPTARQCRAQSPAKSEPRRDA